MSLLPLLLTAALSFAPSVQFTSATITPTTGLVREDALYQRRPGRTPKRRKRQRRPIQTVLEVASVQNLSNGDPYDSTRVRSAYDELSQIASPPKSDAPPGPDSPYATINPAPPDTARDRIALQKQKNDPHFTSATYDRDSLAHRVVYPRVARNNNIEGRVVMHVRIDANGKVVETIIAHSTYSTIFDSEARRAITATPFTPGKVRGVAVESWLEIPITFKLSD